MVEKLRPDELEAFKEAFDMFDKNMDGTISTKELHAAMRRGGQNPTESEVQDMINTVNDHHQDQDWFDDWHAGGR